MNIKGHKVCIIFGINGQDGYYLRSILESEGLEVIGISRSDGPWIKGDVADYELVKNLIVKYQPEYIFHLAANSTTSHHAAFENHKTISDGAINILESVNQYSKHTKVFLSGSGLQFINNGKPIKETDPFISNSIYAAERIYTVYAAHYYRQIGLKVYIGYFFHHDSPMRHERHLNMKVIKTALRIKNGSNEVLDVGNPNVIKEFNHAQDLMKAVWFLVKQEKIFEAVIGSGIGYKINDWIKICFEIIGVDKKKHVRITPGYQAEFSSMISDPKTIRSLGWKPSFDIHYLANDMINNG